jgi:hypothetical protein
MEKNTKDKKEETKKPIIKNEMVNYINPDRRGQGV